MKICYIIDAHTVLSQRIAEYFADSGCKIKVLTLVSRYPSTHENIEISEFGLKERDIKIPYMEHLDNVMKVKSEVKNYDPDIVNGHYLTSSASQIISIHRKYPVVLSAWGSDVLIDSRAKHHRMLIKRAAKRADVITSVASLVTDKLVELGVKPEKIVTFPFGIDMSVFNPDAKSDKLRSELKIEGENKVIISTRMLEPLYNLELLISAMEKVVKIDNGIKLIIVGSGSLEEKLKEQAKDLKLQNNIIFTGFVKHEKLPEFLNLADIYVSTSLSDGASVSLLEAMACRVFPVVSDIPPNREWVQHGKNGFIFDKDDAVGLAELIIKATESSKLRSTAMLNNYNLVIKTGEWNKNMEQLQSIYSNLLKA